MLAPPTCIEARAQEYDMLGGASFNVHHMRAYNTHAGVPVRTFRLREKARPRHVDSAMRNPNAPDLSGSYRSQTRL